MAQQVCRPAQGWADASVEAGLPARPAQEWRLETLGGDAPPPRAPEKGQGASHGACIVGVAGGAYPQPEERRGRALGEPPIPHHQRPLLEGSAPRAAWTPCSPGPDGEDSGAKEPLRNLRRRKVSESRHSRYSPPRRRTQA